MFEGDLMEKSVGKVYIVMTDKSHVSEQIHSKKKNPTLLEKLRLVTRAPVKQEGSSQITSSLQPATAISSFLEVPYAAIPTQSSSRPSSVTTANLEITLPSPSLFARDIKVKDDFAIVGRCRMLDCTRISGFPTDSIRLLQIDLEGPGDELVWYEKTEHLTAAEMNDE